MNMLNRFLELINSLKDIRGDRSLFDRNRHWEKLQEFMRIYNDHPSIYHNLNNEQRQKFMELSRIYNENVNLPGRPP